MYNTKQKSTSQINKILQTVCCILVILLFYHLQNKTLNVSEYCYENQRIPDGFDQFRIVQISDLHNARFGKDNQRLIGKIESCDPDVIVITGDLVDSYFTNIPVSLSFVKQACKLAPVYYVSGNHECCLDSEEFEELMNGLEEAGAVVLEDECIPLESKDDSISLIGLKDESLQGGMLRILTEQAAPSQLSLLLAHEPQYLDSYSECQVDLVFSGHAHGGLVRIPFIGGLIAPDQGFFPKYTEGMHESGDTTMVISRGIGNSSVSVRLFNRPEIVCVELQCPANDGSD